MLKMLVLKIHNLTFNDAQIDFNDYTICVILHAKISYGMSPVTH